MTASASVPNWEDMEGMAMKTLLITKQSDGLGKSILPHQLTDCLQIVLSRVMVNAPGGVT